MDNVTKTLTELVTAAVDVPMLTAAEVTDIVMAKLALMSRMYTIGNPEVLNVPNTEAIFDFLPAEAGILAFPADPIYVSGRVKIADGLVVGSSKTWLTATPTSLWGQNNGGLAQTRIVMPKQKIHAETIGRAMFMLPLAQAWGGAVDAVVDVSFYVAVPPSQTITLKFKFCHGYKGTNGDGTPATNVEAGTEVDKLNYCDNKCKLLVNAEHNLMTSPYVHLKMPVKYVRGAQIKPGAIDNQYFAILFSDKYDSALKITDLRFSFHGTPLREPPGVDWDNCGWYGTAVQDARFNIP